MTNETESLIDELRAARERATQGNYNEWSYDPDSLGYQIWASGKIVAGVAGLPDAAFITLAYNSLPALLDALEAARAERDELRQYLREANAYADKLESQDAESSSRLTLLEQERDAARQAAIGECKEIAHARYKKANKSMNDYDLGAADAALKIKKAIVALAAQEEDK